MSNFLNNGTVLPHGLLGCSPIDRLRGFNQTYKNTGLKAGIVIRAYAFDDPLNRTGLCTEYDVLVIEQDEDKGTTGITYRNCLYSQGFGSISDFFEFNLRPKTKTLDNSDLTEFSGQDGAIVLIQCLDGLSDRGIVIGAINHPDRSSNIPTTEPQLAGEYNGVNIVINQDGSCALTFKGATQNDGTPTDASQGNTVLQIETDGSFQFSHSAVTIRGDKNGQATITTQADCVINCVNANVNASEKVNVTSGGDTAVNAGGDCDITASGDCSVTATGNAVVQAVTIQLNGQSGMILTTQTDPVVDSIFGFPTQGVPTVTSG
jgi:hypothetical protein